MNVSHKKYINELILIAPDTYLRKPVDNYLLQENYTLNNKAVIKNKNHIQIPI